MKTKSELEKMTYAELSKYKSEVGKNKKSRSEMERDFPYPKSLNDLSHSEIQAMSTDEKEKFKSDYKKGKSEVQRQREEAYLKQFEGIDLAWIDKRLSELYAEVPNEIKYKADLDLLNEARGNSISKEHKKRIDYYIGEIKAGRDVGDIVRYKLPSLWYMGAKQFVSNIIRNLGGERYHKSGKDVKGSVYYQLKNQDTIRISDHELPETEQRQYNRSIGIGGKWIEIVLDTPKPFSELKPEVLETINEGVGEGEMSKGFEKETEQIKAKIKEMKGEMEFGGTVEPQNYRLDKSIVCKHKPTQKGTTCTRRTLNSVAKCWQHL